MKVEERAIEVDIEPEQIFSDRLDEAVPRLLVPLDGSCSPRTKQPSLSRTEATIHSTFSSHPNMLSRGAQRALAGRYASVPSVNTSTVTLTPFPRSLRGAQPLSSQCIHNRLPLAARCTYHTTNAHFLKPIFAYDIPQAFATVQSEATVQSDIFKPSKFGGKYTVTLIPGK